MPRPHLTANELVNLVLGSHIHSLGGLIEHEQMRLGAEPFGQNHFLLVPPAQALGNCVDTRRLDPPFLKQCLAAFIFRATVDTP